jgi:hypothetical protein
MLTRKDYRMIADTINDHMKAFSTEETHFQLLNNIIEGLCTGFANNNPRFSKDKFLDAIYKDISPQVTLPIFSKDNDRKLFWNESKK